MKMPNKLFKDNGVVEENETCANCRKKIKSASRTSPEEYPSNTVGAMCEQCHSFLCQACRWRQKIDKCPKCGSYPLYTVSDEYVGK